MKKFVFAILIVLGFNATYAANPYDNSDTLYVSRDGTCEFRNIADAIEVCRAFMDYHKVIYVKNGTYKEKIEIPTWLTNIEICGENPEKTILTWDDHANIKISDSANGALSHMMGKKMGTFRTYTLKVCGENITVKNITIENNSARLGQAVSLHVEGDKCCFINCRLLGHQDTVYTGRAGVRQYFHNCYIEGTTDFIFGPSTAWFEGCVIRNKTNSYVTAASTPKDVKYGYIFNNCKVIAKQYEENRDGDISSTPLNKCYLGRPWRPYAYTLFMNCELGGHILPIGWHNWGNKNNEQTSRYLEYNNTGAGAAQKDKKGNATERATWSRQLTKAEAAEITLQEVFDDIKWIRTE